MNRSTVMTMLLASLAFTGTCEVSPVFRLGSGAGATNHPPPLASSNASMPLVAFVLLFGLIGLTMLLLSWTYLVSWQDTAGYWDHHFHRKVTKALAKHLSMSKKQLDEYKTAVCSMPKDTPRTGPKKRRCYLFTKRSLCSLPTFSVHRNGSIRNRYITTAHYQPYYSHHNTCLYLFVVYFVVNCITTYENLLYSHRLQHHLRSTHQLNLHLTQYSD